MANALGSLSAYTSSTWAAWDPGKLSALCWIEAALSDVSWRRVFFFPPFYFCSSIKSTLQLRSGLFHAYLSCATAISHTISYMSTSWKQLSSSCISNPAWFWVWAHGESCVRPWLGLCNTLWPPAPRLRLPGPAHLQSHPALHQVLP